MDSRMRSLPRAFRRAVRPRTFAGQASLSILLATLAARADSPPVATNSPSQLPEVVVTVFAIVVVVVGAATVTVKVLTRLLPPVTVTAWVQVEPAAAQVPPQPSPATPL